MGNFEQDVRDLMEKIGDKLEEARTKVAAGLEKKMPEIREKTQELLQHIEKIMGEAQESLADLRKKINREK